jgi:hypothetical protein
MEQTRFAGDGDSPPQVLEDRDGTQRSADDNVLPFGLIPHRQDRQCPWCHGPLDGWPGGCHACARQDKRKLLGLARRALYEHPELIKGYTNEMSCRSVKAFRQDTWLLARYYMNQGFDVRRLVKDWVATYRNRPMPASVRVATDELLLAIEGVEDYEREGRRQADRNAWRAAEPDAR